MVYAVIEAGLKRPDRRVSVSEVDIPGAHPNHGNLLAR
jgi:hypothetical protein